MNIFKSQQAMYLQIAELFFENVLMKIWRSGDKLPSVRDTALAFEVNPHTSHRTYDYLQQKGTIKQQEGNGYYLSTDGYEKILSLRRERLLREELPLLFERMQLLEISVEDLQAQYSRFTRKS